MIIRTKGVTLDPEKDIVAIVFESDSERLKVIERLASMPLKDGKRAYVTFPAGTDMNEVEALGKEVTA